MRKPSAFKICLISFISVLVAGLLTLAVLDCFTSAPCYEALYPFSGSHNSLESEPANAMIVNHLYDTSYKNYRFPRHSKTEVPFDAFQLDAQYSVMTSDGFDDYDVFGNFALDFGFNQKLVKASDSFYAYQSGKATYYIDINHCNLVFTREEEELFVVAKPEQWESLFECGGVRLLGENSGPSLIWGDYHLKMRVTTFESLTGGGTYRVNYEEYHFHLNQNEITRGILSSEHSMSPSIQTNILTSKDTKMIYPSGSSFHVDESTRLAFSIDPIYLPAPYYSLDLIISDQSGVLYKEEHFFANYYLQKSLPFTKHLEIGALKNGPVSGEIKLTVSGTVTHLFPITESFEVQFRCQFIWEGGVL